MPSTENSAAPWLRSLAVVGGVAAILSLGWLLPGSPVSLWRADHALTSGDPESAAELYDDVAESGWWESLRRSALERSAAVHADRLQDSVGARARLERLLLVSTVDSDRAALRERIAWSQADAGELAAASTAFLAAAEADPTAPKAAERLVLAARHAHSAQDVGREVALWERVRAEHPERAQIADLALGRLALADDRAQEAHALFEAAARVPGRADVVVAARLGAATALERLGSLDGAIAEIDDLELPEGVAESRLGALRLRREAKER